MKKIDLEDIFKDNIIIDLDGCYTKHSILESMKEACSQILELAAENGEVVYMSETLGEIKLSTTENKKYVLNKQSILDTINQIK